MTNAPVELQIEKIVFGGDGLARLPKDDSGRQMTVFVPYTLPGERVAARLGQVQKGFAKASPLEVIAPSPERRKPPCPYFGRCGGCQLQHGTDAWQLTAKKQILLETFSRAGIVWNGQVETVTGEPLGYRTRIHLRVSTQDGWRLGYLERRSNRIIPIRECPIAAPVLQRAIATLQSPDVTRAAPELVTDIELVCDTAQHSVQLSASGPSAKSAEDSFHVWMRALQWQLPELSGGELQFPDNEGSLKKAASFGKASLDCAVGDFTYRVSTGAFFQGNRFLVAPLAEAVVSAANAVAVTEVWDLYAGVGLFSLPLAARGARVTAVEGAPVSAKDLQQNLAGHSAQVKTTSVETFLAVKRSPAPQCIVVDPPRTGLGKEVTAHLLRISPPRLVYLSCDPPTLARDLQALTASGYRIGSVTLFDLFPQTFHMETLVVLNRG